MSDKSISVQDILVDVLRQYRHNDSDEFVFGYDKAVTDRIIEDLINRYDEQRAMKAKARAQRDRAVKLLNDLVNATEVVLAISDRDHDAWDVAKAAIAIAKGEVKS